MPDKDPRQADVSKQPPAKSETPNPQELSDDDLKSISGGLGSTGGSTVTSNETSVCISAL